MRSGGQIGGYYCIKYKLTLPAVDQLPTQSLPTQRRVVALIGRFIIIKGVNFGFRVSDDFVFVLAAPSACMCIKQSFINIC